MAAALKLASPEPQGRLSEIERGILEVAAGSIKLATELYTEQVLKDHDLLLELLEPTILRHFCYSRLRRLSRANHSLVTTGNYSQERNAAARVEARAASNLMTFELPNGRLLRDARKGDLLQVSQSYSKAAERLKVNARWLGYVAGWLKRNDLTVGQQLTEGKLRELRQKAEELI